jgi:hypothetical protein
MVLSVEKNFLFIHIPKTGGSSMEEALFNYQSFNYHEVTHGVSLQYKDYLDDDFYFSLYKFAFVRNPWDLQASCWRYYVRENNIDMTFDEFIKWKFTGSIIHKLDKLPKTENASIEMLRGAFYTHRTPQTYYLIDEKGNFLVDYIGSFERLEEHYKLLVDKLELEDNFLPRVNVSSKPNEGRDYRKLYTEETKELVRSRFELDIKMYGYSFDDVLPIREKIGEINETNNTLSKRGYNLPIDFYFSFGDLPYGLTNIKSRYDNETSNQYHLEEFKRNKSNRRLNSLMSNINTIQENIDRMENEIVDNPDDTYLFNKYKREMYLLREKQIIYKIEMKKIERALREANQ